VAGLKVVWTRTAVKQRDLVFEYWTVCNGNKEYSKKILFVILANIEIVKQYPNIAKLTKYDSIRSMTVLENYSLLYKYDDINITIVGFWDNRQNPYRLYKLLNNRAK
jgi:hypothetical protein